MIEILLIWQIGGRVHVEQLIGMKVKIISKKNVNPRVPVPNELIEDFAILNVLPGVPLEDCKHAWKVLLKRVHPDVSNSQGEATSDTVIRLNNSYRRIETWFNTGKIIK